MTMRPLLLANPSPAKRHGVRYSFVIRATHDGVRKVQQDCDSLLDAHQVTPDIANAIRIVFAEALNNIVEHAYDGQSDGTICLRVWISENTIRFRITDFGLALPGKKLPISCFPDIDVPKNELPEGGFGWPLIHALVQHLSYQCRNGWNILQFQVDR